MGETIDALLVRARRRLKAAGVVEANLDARILVAAGLGVDTAVLVSGGDRTVDAQGAERAWALIERRALGEPVGRILGVRAFHGLDFELGPDTLEPRGDTEVLVGAVLDRVRRGAVPGSAPDGAGLTFVDVGTGTGAIAIAIAVALPQALGIATDLAPGALAVAHRNAVRHGVVDRIAFREGSFLDPVEAPVALIVSNPPYIASGEIEGLSREVRDHDPRLALDGGADGLEAYRALIAQASYKLSPGGTFALEIGWDQKKSVSNLLSFAGFCEINAVPDLAGHDRVLVALRPI
jgi:release factor glutamine methyltransferase